jgi:hypothetical protein
LTQAEIQNDHPQYAYDFSTIALSGWATFPNLVNKADLAASTVIVFDQSNDGADDLPCFEAFIRKCSVDGQKVIPILNPSWTATTDDQIDIPNNLTALQGQRAICAALGIDYVDGHLLTKAHVTAGGHITDWFADTAHYNATGGAAIRDDLLTILPTGGTVTTPLPAYVNAAAEDYMGTPVIILGTDYDSKTGTWTETGTRVESSEVGATITYSGTFRKFGIYRASGNYTTVTVTIDGGDPINDFALYANGYDIGTRGAHTVVITVTSAVRIDEFWAV